MDLPTALIIVGLAFSALCSSLYFLLRSALFLTDYFKGALGPDPSSASLLPSATIARYFASSAASIFPDLASYSFDVDAYCDLCRTRDTLHAQYKRGSKRSTTPPLLSSSSPSSPSPCLSFLVSQIPRPFAPIPYTSCWRSSSPSSPHFTSPTGASTVPSILTSSASSARSAASSFWPSVPIPALPKPKPIYATS